jgi:hypothetical protein
MLQGLKVGVVAVLVDVLAQIQDQVAAVVGLAETVETRYGHI